MLWALVIIATSARGGVAIESELRFSEEAACKAAAVELLEEHVKTHLGTVSLNCVEVAK